jgi:hypothetical protein
MTAHLTAGNVSEALEQFGTYRRILDAELSVDPSPQMFALDSQLLRTDSDPVTLIHGTGGIGKSALVAKHMLDSMERRQARGVFLNFDDTALDARVPATLLDRMASQLSAQVDPGRRSRAERLAVEARDLARLGDRGLEVSSRGAQVGSHEWIDLAHALVAVAAPSRRRPLLVVVDTFEQVQRREVDAVFMLQSFLAELRSASGHARAVVAGRAPEPILVEHPVRLDGLARDEATKLLRRLVPTVPGELADRVTGQLGTSPLTLRLVAATLQRSGDLDDDLLDLKLWEGRIDGELYRRLLDHIKDKEVQKLAHPGLTVRRITRRSSSGSWQVRAGSASKTRRTPQASSTA